MSNLRRYATRHSGCCGLDVDRPLLSQLLGGETPVSRMESQQTIPADENSVVKRGVFTNRGYQLIRPECALGTWRADRVLLAYPLTKKRYLHCYDRR
jgi:hypothetical protein